MVNKFKIEKMNNKGMSLIEIMVTIAMIIIMAGPLINGFLNAMGVNSHAREIQNGTTVGQDMMEKFEALTIEELTASGSPYVSYMTENGETDGIYKFEDIPVTGANKEKFKIDITLDPNAYVPDGVAGGKVEVNNVNIPGMSSLHGSNSVMLYKHYIAFDDKLKEMFSGRITDENILNNIYQEAYRKKVSKSTNIDIKRVFNTAINKFEYDITLSMTYTYNDGTSTPPQVTETRYVEDVTFTKNEPHNIYLICPVFDIYNYNHYASGISYCTDTINIIKSYSDDYDENVVNFYIAEQNTNNLSDAYSTFKQRINPAKVLVNLEELSDHRAHNTQDPYIKLYTNIGVVDSITDTTDLTHIDENTGNELYTMTVKVKLDGKVIADFTSSKAD